MAARPRASLMFAFSFLVSGLFAKDAPKTSEAKPADWPVRTFQIGKGLGESLYLSQTPEEIKLGTPKLKPLPPSDAPESELIENVRHNTRLLLKSALLQDCIFPEGTAFLYDCDSGTLAVRTSPMCMESVEALRNEVISKTPHYLTLRFEVFQAEAMTVRRMLREAAGKVDNSRQFQEMTTLASEEAAKHLGTLRLETRSGLRAMLDSSQEHSHCTGFKLDDKGHLEVENETRPVGLKVEVDPVLGPDRDSIGLNYALEYHFAPPVERVELVGQAPPLGRIEAPVTDYRVAKFTTAIASSSGLWQLLNVYRPSGTPDLDETDVLHVAFLRMDVVKNLTTENKTLASSLATVMDKACPIPANQTVIPNPPPGMQTRTFSVPPDFMSCRMEPPPAKDEDLPRDPFSPGKEQTKKRPTAREILEYFGIRFPEGATASCFAGSGKLVVTSTPENLDAIEALLGGILHCPPIALSFTTHILQAEGSVMRQLVQETTGIADHSLVWKKVEELVARGEATILSTEHSLGRSGQRHTMEAGEEHSYVAKFAKNDDGQMTATYETRPVGTRWEIDPIVGPDGYTMDVSLALEYHHTPPTMPEIAPQTVGAPFRAQALQPKFHASKLTTAITLGNGMTRLLGVWKPEGTPEFDKGDILQAAFIKADVVRVERE